MMIKKLALAGVAAAAFAAVPASAAIVVYSDVGAPGPADNQTIFLGPASNSQTGAFSFQVSDNGTGQAFTASYWFNNTAYDPATGQATITFSTTGSDNLEFTGATIGGAAAQLFINNNTPGNGAFTFVLNQPLPLGMTELTVSGNLLSGQLSNAVAGQLTLSAVPEPTTWALFILGFGAVGYTMRRRGSKARVAKASLNFA